MRVKVSSESACTKWRQLFAASGAIFISIKWEKKEGRLSNHIWENFHSDEKLGIFPGCLISHCGETEVFFGEGETWADFPGNICMNARKYLNLLLIMKNSLDHEWWVGYKNDARIEPPRMFLIINWHKQHQTKATAAIFFKLIYTQRNREETFFPIHMEIFFSVGYNAVNAEKTERGWLGMRNEKVLSLTHIRCRIIFKLHCAAASRYDEEHHTKKTHWEITYMNGNKCELLDEEGVDFSQTNSPSHLNVFWH